MATAKYKATIMDAETGAENTYEFEAEPDLFDKPRAKLIEAFMSYVDHVELPKEDIGYDIVSAFKDRERKVVTCIGTMRLHGGDIPFMAMISAA